MNWFKFWKKADKTRYIDVDMSNMVNVEVYCPKCNMYKGVKLNTYTMQGDVFCETGDAWGIKQMKCSKCGLTCRTVKRC